MKVGIASVQVPFIRGGAEILAENLAAELRSRDFEADVITIPFKWYPPRHILELVEVVDKIDITEVNGSPVDRLVTLKFPMYYVRHPNKVAWILHQHRQAYDLFETPFGDLHHDPDGIAVAEAIRALDRERLPMHRALYGISRTVVDRLARYSGLEAGVLYPPPEDHELYGNSGYGDYILAPGRLDGMKRQQLAIEALVHAPADLRLVIIGNAETAYGAQARELVDRLGLGDRVDIRGIVTPGDKLALYAGALGIYNGVHNEDYGYVTIEGFASGKAVITHTDSGGPLEFVTDGDTGLVTDPDPAAVGLAMGRLTEPGVAAAMGQRAAASLQGFDISWDSVISRLVA